MTYIYHNGGEDASGACSGFEKLLEELQSGDCMVVERLSCAAKDSAELLALLEKLGERGIRFRSVEEKFDTGSEEGRLALELLKKLLQMDARSKNPDDGSQDGKAKGRKPIEVDEELFDSILERWKSGEITARQAMAELNLKPNTFYRRVKERMPDAKSAESLIDAAKKIGKDIVTTVTEGSEELQQAAGKFAAEHDMGNISETVKKNINAAGAAFSRTMDSLSRDFQDAMERFEKKQRPSAGTEEPIDAVVEEAEEPEKAPEANPAPEAAEAPQSAAAVETEAAEEATTQPEEKEYL